ncbi:unnamed protein product [Candidula unifasciata]|uniref:Protein kinase domain-containing protein n=1 Tax=Candidula unifasciata TaxID=100452 RepID=A0A8S3ZQS8_9EUPU|nr:unnamed protein product [Candidula unifasciata]
MGCVSTKLVPELHPNAHLVETFYCNTRQDVKISSFRPVAVLKTHAFLQSVETATRREKSNSEIAHEGQNVGGNTHGKKYRDKFDSRVTTKYDVKALIGKGSFSRVVRVEHRITKQPYAIKMIDKIQGKEVFEAELNVLRRVKHVYIIQLLEVFEAVDKVYMVMELATGGELFDRIIAKGSFTERDAVKVLIMVLDGVKYLHGLGITHRDLKPENLLYYHPGHDSKIMITDFGLSAIVSSQDSHMTTTCGTPEYIAPEILARQPYTSQVDLWAIGVITYVLLSGTMPFDDEDRTQLYRLIIKGKYSFAGQHWKDISSLAKDFINKTMTLDPNERLTASQACRHPWLTRSSDMTSNKNLHRTISLNLLQRQSRSASSSKSSKSAPSSKSGHSLRSDRRRVQPEDVDQLLRDPEIQAELASLKSQHSDQT